jgi:CO/xanthine dehydrogenase FAD-binding subunit
MTTQTLSALPVTDAGLLRLEGHNSLQSVYEAENTPALLRWAIGRSFVWQRRNDTEVLQASLSMDQGPMWAAALLAWDAQIAFDSGEVASLAAYVKREIKPKGRPEAILIQPETENLRWGTSEVSRLPTDTPIVGAVAVVEMEDGKVKDVRVALTGVWKRTAQLAQTPTSLACKTLTETGIDAVAKAIAKEVTPKSDYLGSEEYRRAMAEVTSRDALTQCLKEREQ